MKYSKFFYKFMVFICRFPLFLVWRYKIINKNSIPKDGRYIVASNHISGTDPAIITLGQKRIIRYMGKAELFKNPVLSFFFKQLGAFAVNRGKGDTSAINDAKQMIDQGDVIGIFIEGTRSKTGELLKPKSGAVMIAHQMDCKLIPVSICKPLEKKHFFFKKYVRFGEPVSCEELGVTKGSPREYREASRKLMGIISDLREQDL